MIIKIENISSDRNNEKLFIGIIDGDENQFDKPTKSPFNSPNIDLFHYTDNKDMKANVHKSLGSILEEG